MRPSVPSDSRSSGWCQSSPRHLFETIRVPRVPALVETDSASSQACSSIEEVSVPSCSTCANKSKLAITIASFEREVLLRRTGCGKRRQKDDSKTSLLFSKRPLPSTLRERGKPDQEALACAK